MGEEMKKRRLIEREDLKGKVVDGITVTTAYEDPQFNNPNDKRLHGKAVLRISGINSAGKYVRLDIPKEEANVSQLP